MKWHPLLLYALFLWKIYVVAKTTFIETCSAYTYQIKTDNYNQAKTEYAEEHFGHILKMLGCDV
jgi:hypothetical protein